MPTRRRTRKNNKKYTNHGVVEGPITVRGEAQQVRIKRPTLLIDREQGTNLRINQEPGGTNRLIVEAGRTRPTPRPPEPASERHLFDFRTMHEELIEQRRQMIDKAGFTFGIKTPEYKAKLQPVAKNLAGYVSKKSWKPLKLVLSNKWLAIHPLQLGYAIISSQKGGLLKLRRDQRTAKIIEALNKRYTPEAAKMLITYEAETERALQELEVAVSTNQVNPENRNRYFKKYNKKLLNAEADFKNKSTDIILGYLRELKKKKVLK